MLCDCWLLNSSSFQQKKEDETRLKRGWGIFCTPKLNAGQQCQRQQHQRQQRQAAGGRRGLETRLLTSQFGRIFQPGAPFSPYVSSRWAPRRHPNSQVEMNCFQFDALPGALDVATGGGSHLSRDADGAEDQRDMHRLHWTNWLSFVCLDLADFQACVCE